MDDTYKLLEPLRDDIDELKVAQAELILKHNALDTRVEEVEEFKDTFNNHMQQLKGVMKFGKWVVGSAGLVITILELTKFIGG